jgi:hypothetical protein
MNDKAKKAARRAELEQYLLDIFHIGDKGSLGHFVGWLELQTTGGDVRWRDEAIELIALYGE